MEVVPFFSLIACVVAQFKVQFIGNYTAAEDQTSRDFCQSKQCLIDAEILFLVASQNSSVNPCDDFREFALGEFILNRALNDRYQYKGLQSKVDGIYKEKVRKLLGSKVKASDSKPSKIIKRYFNKCVNSTHVSSEGKLGISGLLHRLGGSPFLNRQTRWKSDDFNLTQLFEQQPVDAMSLFLDIRVARCKKLGEPTEEILCFKSDYSWIYTDSSRDDMTQILLYFTEACLTDEAKKEDLKVEINAAVEHFLSFLKLKDSAKNQTKGKRETKLFKLSDVSNLTPNLSIDWNRVVNSQLLNHSQVNGEAEIQIENPRLLSDLADIVSRCANEILADSFVLGFLYLHQWIYNVYPFDLNRQEQRGTKKAYQRWETCMKEFQYNMRPALEIMYSEQYLEQEVLEGARVLTREVINTSFSLIRNQSELSVEALADVLGKLDNMNITIGFTTDELTREKLEEYYNELELDGFESYIKLWQRVLRHHQKVQREPATEWRRQLDTFTQNVYIKYDAEQNVLYIPSEWIVYPWFHPQRPKFFNTATLFSDVIEAVAFGLAKYIRDHWKLSRVILGLENTEDVSYNFYKSWIASHEDLQLGANLLTNQQLFWMAAARKFFIKYQPNIPKDLDPIGQLQNEYLHVVYKRQPGFQDAFNCLMTVKDWKDYSEYQQEYRNLVTTSG